MHACTIFIMQMEISFHISWRRDHFPCDSSIINAGSLIGDGSLTCQYGCSATVSSLKYMCTEYSIDDNWSFGSNVIMYNFTAHTGRLITIGTAFSGWISPFSNWNVSTTFSLTPRTDNGQINSSPRTVSLPLRLQSGCHHTIPITVNDPDGDVVQCRWAVGNECASVCNGIPGAVLNSNCTITYYANRGTGYKVVAVMVEDFIPGSSQPLSSVALQFLVLVVSSSQPCSQKPKFISPTPSSGSCLSVLPGGTIDIQLIAYSGNLNISMQQFQIISPSGTIKGELKHIGNSSKYAMNISWTPLTHQQNKLHHFCFMAINSDGVASEQSCIEIAAGFSPTFPISEKHLFTESNVTLFIKFNKNIHRSLSTAFISFYESDSDLEVYRIDASSSSEVTFDNPIQITVKPNFSFAQDTSYYLGFERAIVWRSVECTGSEPIRNKTYWAFKIGGM